MTLALGQGLLLHAEHGKHIPSLIERPLSIAFSYSRARKIKCDGGKPECNNCTKRAKADEPCAYDAAPRRRGPDKQKGGRQRMTKEAKQRMLQGTDTSGASTS